MSVSRLTCLRAVFRSTVFRTPFVVEFWSVSAKEEPAETENAEAIPARAASSDKPKSNDVSPRVPVCSHFVPLQQMNSYQTNEKQSTSTRNGGRSMDGQ